MTPLPQELPKIVHEDFEKSGTKPAVYILHLQSTKPGSKQINIVRMSREQHKLYMDWRTGAHLKSEEGEDLGPIDLEEVFPEPMYNDEKRELLRTGIPDSEWEEIFAEMSAEEYEAIINGEAFIPPNFLK